MTTVTRGWRVVLLLWVVALTATALAVSATFTQVVAEPDHFPRGTVITGWLIVGGSLLLVLASPAFALSQRTALRQPSPSRRAAVVRAWLNACRLVAWFVVGLAAACLATVPLGGVSLIRLVLGPLAVLVVLAFVLAIQVGIVATHLVSSAGNDPRGRGARARTARCGRLLRGGN